MVGARGGAYPCPQNKRGMMNINVMRHLRPEGLDSQRVAISVVRRCFCLEPRLKHVRALMVAFGPPPLSDGFGFSTAHGREGGIWLPDWLLLLPSNFPRVPSAYFPWCVCACYTRVPCGAICKCSSAPERSDGTLVDVDRLSSMSLLIGDLITNGLPCCHHRPRLVWRVGLRSRRAKDVVGQNVVNGPSWP
eukprot:3903661-Pyramimonas_sp.AAC.1